MSNEISKNKIRILHVDDEPDILSVVKTILEGEGYEVISVLNGKQAIAEIELDDLSLIILDIMMPDMSGWDLFTRISKFNSNYKVIFLSIVDITEERLNTLKLAGVRDYIIKPFDKDDFILRVKKVLDS